MQNLIRFAGIATFTLIITLIIIFTPPSAHAGGKSMLYLVKFKAAEAGVPANRGQATELLEKLIIPSLEKLAFGALYSASHVRAVRFHS